MVKKKEDKRELILNAAIRVFAKRGYYPCRTLDISSEAGVAYGSLYSYFKSKDDILLSIFRDRWMRLLDRIDGLNRELEDPSRKIDEIFKYIFRSYDNYPEMMKVMIMEVPRLEQFYTPENQKLYNRFFQEIAKIIKEGQEKGVFSKEISPLVGSFTLAGAVDTVIRQYVFNPGFKKKKYPLEEVIGQTLNILKRGVLEKALPGEAAVQAGGQAKGKERKVNSDGRMAKG